MQNITNTLLKLFICIFLLAFSFTLNAQNWQWAKKGNGTGADAGWSVATDKAGNVYVAGNFSSLSINFNGITLYNASAGASDIFLVKYDSFGNVLWAKRAGGKGNDGCWGIATDASGNICMTGFFYSSPITFGTINLYNVSGSSDVFTAKYSPSGTVLWAQEGGGTNSNTSCGYSVATDISGNVYITGIFLAPSIVFGSDTLHNTGNYQWYNVFLVKYTSAGGEVWAKSMGGVGQSQGFGVTTDAGGNVIFTGAFWSPTIPFGSFILTNTSSGGGNIFIAKYDAAGNALWAKNFGNGYNESYSVTTDTWGNAYITGYFKYAPVTIGTYTLSNAGDNDFFIAKYSPNGSVIWTQRAGGAKQDQGYCVATDKFGNVYATGGFLSSSITFGSVTLTAPAGGMDPMFIVKYDSSGNVLCASSLADGGGKNSNWEWLSGGGNGIATDGYCNTYITSSFQSSTLNIGNTTLTQNGIQNVFVAKYTCNLLAQATQTNLLCNAQCIGTATAIAAGNGTPQYTYSWSNGASASSISNLCAGNYTVSITDSLGCLASTIVTITQPPALANTALVVTNYCSSTYAGSASINVWGGTPAYTYSWSSGQTTSSITNLLAGNYSVTITDANGCADTSMVTIPSFPPPTPLITGTDTICEGNNAALTAGGGVSYSWSTGASAQTISVSPTTQTTYSVVVTAPNGCKADTSVTVIVLPNPTANAGNNVTIDYGSSVSLIGAGGGSYYWSNGSGSDSIFVSPTATTTYTFIVTDANGCTSFAEVTVFVNSLKCPIYLPNVFSPNSDGENDFFRLYDNALCMKSAHVLIYDRWGEKVFESSDKDFKWDGTSPLGKKLNSGVYVYHLEVSYWEYEDKTIFMHGNVSLMR
ncbi:MAG: gliding motility-associated C-terminal domain-containing protein [Bacteroidetes bacterium]|nr:gliding motility-associated C-terminal domain-containing protein [Bacteroidota bacterium]